MSSVYLQLQSKNQDTLNIEGNKPVPFDTVVSVSNEEDISYDPVTDMISIKKAGAYFITWSVVVASAPAEAVFGLVASTGKIIQSGSPLATEEVTGSAIIKVVEGGVEVALINLADVTVQLATVDVEANLTVQGLEVSDTPKPATGGAIVNFHNGGVDIANPLTYPILLNVLQFSWLSNLVQDLIEICTPNGFEQLLDLPEGVLGSFIFSRELRPLITTATETVGSLAQSLTSALDLFDGSGLVSVDSYIGHTNVGIVPSIAGVDFPLLKLVAGPPYPQIIAKEGVITAFSAEYDTLVGLDASILGFLPGALNTINGLIDIFAGTIGTIITLLGSLLDVFVGLGAPLPADFADRLNNLIMTQLNTGTPDSNLHVHAVLWKGTPNDPDALGGDVNWQKVSDLDLGAVKWAELAPMNSFLSVLGDVATAGGNLLTSLLTLLGSKGLPNHDPVATPYMAASTDGLAHPILSGDYLMVQFTMTGGSDLTILAGVIATNLMASVTIE
ncbi:MAG: hypothetical protein LBV33_05605 [Lachnospiraceae bacterium]|jgi:hypothetical protein|nr:hypothetical protein [Lachnospiraceae bacterium]